MHWTALETKKYFSHSPPDKLYHYTSFDGLNGIVESKSFRLTKIRYLNDKSELHHGFDIFQKRVDHFCDKSLKSYEKDFIKNLADHLDPFRNTNICVGSFCEDPDLLSQWRAYGDNGSGVAIGFKTKPFKNISSPPPINLWKCIYSEVKKRNLVDEIINNALNRFSTIYDSHNGTSKFDDFVTDLRAQIIFTFMHLSPVIKHRKFREEGEWRLVSNSISNTHSNYHAQFSSNRVSQYFALDFDNLDNGKYEFIEEVVVGPTNDPKLIVDALGVLLDNHAYNYQSLKFSQIPYKT